MKLILKSVKCCDAKVNPPNVVMLQYKMTFYKRTPEMTLEIEKSFQGPLFKVYMNMMYLNLNKYYTKRICT